ncbi:MAG: transposase, partial [Rhodobacter sp.]
MRGTQGSAGSRFSCAGLEARIPAHHPLRKVRQVETDAPSRLDADFGRLCCARGRPSIAPERLMCASLIRVLFPVRSGCQLMEQMQHDLRFRRFAGPGINDPVRVPA